MFQSDSVNLCAVTTYFPGISDFIVGKSFQDYIIICKYICHSRYITLFGWQMRLFVSSHIFDTARLSKRGIRLCGAGGVIGQHATSIIHSLARVKTSVLRIPHTRGQ